MKKTFFILCALLIFACQTFSQVATDTIQIKQGLGPVFMLKDKALRPVQMLEIMKDNTEAYNEMKIARKNLIVGNIIGGIGGFMFGWQLGGAVAGTKINGPMLLIGAGLTGVSIPFSIAYSKHAKKAVKIYNKSKEQKRVTSNSLEMNLGFSLNGVGMRVTF